MSLLYEIGSTFPLRDHVRADSFWWSDEWTVVHSWEALAPRPLAGHLGECRAHAIVVTEAAESEAQATFVVVVLVTSEEQVVPAEDARTVVWPTLATTAEEVQLQIRFSDALDAETDVVWVTETIHPERPTITEHIYRVGDDGALSRVHYDVGAEPMGDARDDASDEAGAASYASGFRGEHPRLFYTRHEHLGEEQRLTYRFRDGRYLPLRSGR